MNSVDQDSIIRHRKEDEDVLSFYTVTSESLRQKIADPKNQRRGGGVLLFLTNQQDGHSGFLLAKSRKGVCSDMGGSSSASEITLMEAAVRELREETCNTFTVSQESALKLEHSIRLQNYICYVLHIVGNIDDIAQVFDKNNTSFQQLGEDQVPRCWRGKSDLVFFPLNANSHFLTSFDINSNEFTLIDSDGKSQVIRDRTAIIIHSILSEGMQHKLPERKLKQFNNNHTHPLLINPEFAFIRQTETLIIE